MSVPNIEKLFQYLHCVSKNPITFSGRFDPDKEKYIPEIICKDKITDIRLNSRFFLTDSCQMCGGCCPAESNVYTSSEYESIQKFTSDDMKKFNLDASYLDKLKSGLIQETYIINDEKVSIWVYRKELNQLYLPTREKIIDRCSWCYQESEKIFKCRIHPIESITCIMPHLRIFHVNGSNRSSIGISQFGRNWSLKCPVDLTDPQTEEQFNLNKENRIGKLIRLHRVGQDLNIETYIPQIIDYLDIVNFRNYENYLGVNILNRQKRLF